MKLNGLLIQKQNRHVQSDEMNACLKWSYDDGDQTHLNDYYKTNKIYNSYHPGTTSRAEKTAELEGRVPYTQTPQKKR